MESQQIDPRSVEGDPTDLGLVMSQFEIDGKRPNVYFQAPGAESMRYPAIRYRRDRMDIQHADNVFYRNTTGYLVTVIDRDPRNPFRLLVLRLPGARHERSYEADNLYHDVFHVNY